MKSPLYILFRAIFWRAPPGGGEKVKNRAFNFFHQFLPLVRCFARKTNAPFFEMFLCNFRSFPLEIGDEKRRFLPP